MRKGVTGGGVHSFPILQPVNSSLVPADQTQSPVIIGLRHLMNTLSSPQPTNFIPNCMGAGGIILQFYILWTIKPERCSAGLIIARWSAVVSGALCIDDWWSWGWGLDSFLPTLGFCCYHVWEERAHGNPGPTVFMRQEAGPSPEYEIHSLGEYQPLNHHRAAPHNIQYPAFLVPPNNQSTRECLVWYNECHCPVDH